MENSLRTILFTESDRGDIIARVQVPPERASEIVHAAERAQTRLKEAAEVLVALELAAKSQVTPSQTLQHETRRALRDLAGASRVIADFRDLITGRRPGDSPVH